MMSSYMLPAHRHFHTTTKRVHVTSCLDFHLRTWSDLMAKSDAVFKEIPESRTENKFFPFTGNGLIGFSINKGKMQFYVMTESEAIDVPFVPVILPELDHKFTSKQQAILLNIKEGMLQRLTSYVVNKTCVVVQESFYAHRVHQDILLQDIVVKNSGKLPVTIKLKQYTAGQKSWRAAIQKAKTKSGDITYNVAHGNLDVSGQKEKEMKVFSSLSHFQPTIIVPQKSQNKLTVLSVTRFQLVKNSKKADERKRKSATTEIKIDLSNTVKKRLLDVVDISADTLIKQHVDAWNDIWKVGVSIGSDGDPDSPSSLHVNLTEYYMYSSLTYNRSEPTHKKTECYKGSPTIHNADLWVIPSGVKSLYRQRTVWRRLFETSGCISGTTLFLVRESMVLSFLGLHYHDKQIELAMNPLNLVSNISIRSLSLEQFHSYDVLDIQLYVNRKTLDRTLLVACTGRHKPVIYGCSTGCDRVVELGNTVLKFPVHTTDPVTPLFFISPNRTRLEQIGTTDFMKKAIQNAKTAHQSHLEVHHLKLSPKFWLAVVILIVSFHVIVVKMIYNECRKDRGPGRRRPPFSS